MNFYKNVIVHRGKLLIRGVLNGKEYQEKLDFSPTLYVLSNEQTEYKTLEDGFPDVENPTEELLCITIKNQSNKQIITWGVGDFYHNRDDVTYVKCKTENELLMQFMVFWTKNYPDVITGWNTKFFDLPYLMNRIRHLHGDKVINKLSPWKLIQREEIEVRGKPQTIYDLYGIVMLD